MDKKTKQEMKTKRRDLVKALRMAHNKLISGEHPRLVTDILSGVIVILEMREGLR